MITKSTGKEIRQALKEIQRASTVAFKTMTDVLKKTLCPNCDGEGEILFVQDNYPGLEWRKCPSCQGSGLRGDNK